MKHESAKATGVPAIVLVTLMLALFSVSLGYGVVLPMLPDRIERATGASAGLSTMTGLLTGLYMLALFIFAPLWGWISDRRGRRGVLIIGLAGFGTTMMAFSFLESSLALYAERLLSGLFAAAITPVALAIVADLAKSDRERARRQTLVSLAGMAGFLVGPMAGAILVQISGALPDSGPFAPLSFPLIVTGLLSLGGMIAALATIPGSSQPTTPKPVAGQPIEAEPPLVWRLLFLAFVVAAAVGLFEVGLVLRGQRELGLAPYEIAAMFSECSLIMFVVQAIVFSPLVKPDSTRWLIAPALVVLAGGLFLLPRTSDYALTIGLVGAIASSAGVLAPIVTYWISTKAGAAQGTQLGRQTAAASLGGTLGSVAGGVLFDLPGGGDGSFVVASVGVLVGFVIAVGLPGRLVPRGNPRALRGNDEHAAGIEERSTSGRVRRPF